MCLAAGLALLLSVYPLWGAARQDRRLMALARPLAWGYSPVSAAPFLLLVHAFVVNDFTVRYVAENSNSALPVWYRVAATWGRTRARCCCGFCCSASGPSPSPSSAAGCRSTPSPGAGGDGDDRLWVPAVYPLYLQPVQPRPAAVPPLMAATSIRCCRISA
ncbi:hypothetical protein LNP74_29725 [Klebsiella pneumoniae subsp. pneumoniae]|nr:hypothetical protein [Klebsiella pneumoniae subsp. pneumoniae]